MLHICVIHRQVAGVVCNTDRTIFIGLYGTLICLVPVCKHCCMVNMIVMRRNINYFIRDTFAILGVVCYRISSTNTAILKLDL